MIYYSNNLRAPFHPTSISEEEVIDTFGQTKKSLQLTRAALEAEAHEAAQVSRRLNDNLIEAIKRIWRQLLFIWGAVIILAVFYLVVLGFMPPTPRQGQEKPQVLSGAGGEMTSAEPAPAARTAFPDGPIHEKLLKLLQQIRDAHYKKDIHMFLEAYSPTFADIEQKRDLTLKSWRRYDFLDVQFQVTGLRQEDENTLNGVVNWTFKTLDRKNNAITTTSRSYDVKFTKESGQWLIQGIEPRSKDIKGEG